MRRQGMGDRRRRSICPSREYRMFRLKTCYTTLSMTKIVDTIRMKIFPKGQIVISVSLRKKYNLDIGDKI